MTALLEKIITFTIYMYSNHHHYCRTLYICVVVGGRDSRMTVGSLNYDSGIVDEDQIFILAGYTVPCNGTVVAWEFCYRISNATSVTFYPGIWRITDQESNGDIDYKLIQASAITFNPNGTSSNKHPCQKFTLSDKQQFIAPSGSVIGLYFNTKDVQPLLLRTDEMDNSITTFKFDQQKTQVKAELGKDDVDYNIAITVHLSK